MADDELDQNQRDELELPMPTRWNWVASRYYQARSPRRSRKSKTDLKKETGNNRFQPDKLNEQKPSSKLGNWFSLSLRFLSILAPSLFQQNAIPRFPVFSQFIRKEQEKQRWIS